MRQIMTHTLMFEPSEIVNQNDLEDNLKRRGYYLKGYDTQSIVFERKYEVSNDATEWLNLLSDDGK